MCAQNLFETRSTYIIEVPPPPHTPISSPPNQTPSAYNIQPLTTNPPLYRYLYLHIMIRMVRKYIGIIQYTYMYIYNIRISAYYVQHNRSSTEPYAFFARRKKRKSTCRARQLIICVVYRRQWRRVRPGVCR